MDVLLSKLGRKKYIIFQLPVILFIGIQADRDQIEQNDRLFLVGKPYPRI